MKLGEYRVKSSLRLLPIAAMLAGSMVLAGCGDDNTTSTTGPGFAQVRSPVGTVVGSVVDTNGNPIAGATVTIGSRTATTNAGGQYEIAGVAVTNTVGTITTGGTNNQFIPVTIVPPQGFAGATVTVNPESQIFGDNTVITGTTNPQLVFVDGYTASAGTVRLPALTTRVTGTLRNSATGNVIANEPMSLDFSDIWVDANAAGAPGNTVPANATSVAYAVPYISTTTNANGGFVFTNVPDDSCFVLRSANYIGLMFQTGNPTNVLGCNVPLDSGAQPVDLRGVLISTIAETANTVNLAGILATNDVNADNVSPYVVTVSGVPLPDTGNGPNFAIPGVLSNGLDMTAATGGVVLTFSEPIAANLTDSDLVVTRGAAPNQTAVAATLAVLSATQIRVTTAAPLNPGTTFTINIRRQSLIDAAGNPVSTSRAVLGVNQTVQMPDFDAIAVFGGQPQLQLTLQTFKETNTVADAVTLTQVNAQVTTGNPADQFPFLTTSALVDTVLESQLTNAVDFTGAAVAPGAVATLTAGDLQNFNQPQLANPNQDIFTDLIEEALFGPSARVTRGSVARVNVTLPAANVPVDVVLFVRRNNVILDTLIFPVAGANGAAINAGPVTTGLAPTKNLGTGRLRFVLQPNGLTSFDVVIVGGPGIRLQPGDVLVARSRAQAGLLGGESQLALADNVPPTTTPQLLASQINQTLQVTIGTGGGVVQTGAGDRHLFVLPINPQMLDNADTTANYNNDTLAGGLLRSANAQPELLNFGRPANLGALLPAVTPALSVFHDATSTAAFLGAPGRTLGISVSEPLETPPLRGAPAYNGTAALSSWTSANNVANEGAPLPAPNTGHLVIFNTDSVFTLETDGRSGTGRIIDLTNAIADVNGVVAGTDANARVLVRDFVPPLMTRAFYDGQQLVFDFHEAVRLSGSLNFLDCAPFPQTLNLAAAAAAANPAVLAAGNTRIVIPTTNATVPANISTCFTDPALAYAEAAYTPAALAGLTSLPAGAIDTTPGHGAVVYQSVPDRAAGTVFGTAFPNNTWAAWGASGLGIQAPVFAMADIVGPFAPVTVVRGSTYSTQPPGPGALGDTFNIDITFSQPFFVTDGVVADPRDDFDGTDADEAPFGNDDGVVTQAELLAWISTKFEFFDSTAAAALPPTDVQILDSNNQDITTVTGNNQLAQRLILTFTQGNPIAGGDQVRMVAGSTITAQFDTSSNTLVFPFDQGTGQPQGSQPGNAGDGLNQLEEFQFVPPAPAGYTCPQVTLPSAAPAAGEC